MDCKDATIKAMTNLSLRVLSSVRFSADVAGFLLCRLFHERLLSARDHHHAQLDALGSFTVNDHLSVGFT